MKRRIDRLDGYWWWKAGRKYPGILETSQDGRAVLRLNGRFRGFQSFQAGGRGARSARQVIRGRTTDGRDFTLADCVETSVSTGRSERASYWVGWYLDGALFARFDQLKFKRIAISCDYLNELVGETFISPTYSDNNRGFQISYRAPEPLTADVGEFRVEICQAVPWQLSPRFQVTEVAEAVITARRSLPLEDFWEGPVASFRSLCEFMSEMRLPLRPVIAAYGHRRLKACRVFGLSGPAAKPILLPDHPVRQFLFTARDLQEPSWQQVVASWVRMRHELSSVWSLYSAVTSERSLYSELRFLSLAQALETYHRTRFTSETKVPANEHKERKKRALGALDPVDREWLQTALAWSNELSLRQRLQRLYDRVPRPLIDHMPETIVLVQQIADTRNYLTHFSARGAHVLSGFRFIETTENMRHVLQYFLLLELGFSSTQACKIARSSFVRDLSRSRVSRSMGTS